jgi:hypothetical protein
LTEGHAIPHWYRPSIAPHNVYGHLCHIQRRQAELPGDGDRYRRRGAMEPVLTSTIEDGEFVLPKALGWGIAVDETGVRARPPKH